MSIGPTNIHDHALEHDHDGHGPCPLCRDGEPLLSADDFGRLSLAMTIGTGRHDAAAVGQLFIGAVNARLLNRLLDVALLGHLLPYDIYASREVAWRPTSDLLSAAEITRYRAELQRATSENSDVILPGSLLTRVEHRQLALATAAGFRGEAREVEQTVLEWAEVARDMAQDLDGILAGRLVPYVADDPERLIQVKDVEEMPNDEQVRYRRAFDTLAAANNK